MTLGHYPTLSLADARRKALTILRDRELSIEAKPEEAKSAAMRGSSISVYRQRRELTSADRCRLFDAGAPAEKVLA